MRRIWRMAAVSVIGLCLWSWPGTCQAQGPVTKFFRAVSNLLWTPFELLHGGATGLAQGDAFSGLPRGAGKGSAWAGATLASSAVDLVTLPVPVETWSFAGVPRREALFGREQGG